MEQKFLPTCATAPTIVTRLAHCLYGGKAAGDAVTAVAWQYHQFIWKSLAPGGAAALAIE